MPNDNLAVQVQVHERRLDEVERQIESGFLQLQQAINDLKSKLLGNGTPGVIQEFSNRIAVMEKRSEIDDEVDREVAAMKVEDGYLKTHVKDTPLWAWVMMVIVLGPEGVKLFISLISEIHKLLGGP